MAELKITPKYMLTCGHLFLFALTFLVFSAQSVFSYSLSECQELNTAGAYYSLTKNVSSQGTCFTIKADNITLDGQGYTINYAQSATGYGINNSAGYDNITIKNLDIVQTYNFMDSYGIYFSKEATISNIMNNKITTSTDSIFFKSSSANNITNNNITSSGGAGILFDQSSGSNIIFRNIITSNDVSTIGFLDNSDSNTISDNIIQQTGYLFGIEIINSDFNQILNNDIASFTGITTFDSDSNTISSNNITTSEEGMVFYDGSNNHMTGNRMNTNGNAITIYAKTLSHYNHTIDTTNTEQGDPIYYYFAASSLTIENKNIGQLFIINSTNMDVRNVTMDKGGIILDTVTDSKITNSKISTRVNSLFALNSNSNIISNNSITTRGLSTQSVYLESSNMNTLSDNIILSTGDSGTGIYVIHSTKNTISGGSIISRQSYDYLMEDSSENYFIGTNFTSARNIFLYNRNISIYNNPFFDYVNSTENNVSLKTNISMSANITRTLIKWGKNELIWNDTKSGDIGLIASYTITGLLPDTHYNIYNTSRGTQTKSYTLATDAHGNLPSFTIALKDNTEIKVEDRPPVITINYPEDNTLIIGNTTHFNITTDENATCFYNYWLSYEQEPSYAYVDCFGTNFSQQPSHNMFGSSAFSGGTGFGGCVGVGGGSSGIGLAPLIMDITGGTQHIQNISVQPSGVYRLIANCIDSMGNSNTSSVSVVYRNKPLTIEFLTLHNPYTNHIYINQALSIFLGLTTNYSVDKIMLNITKPDNTTEVFTENDFSEHVSAKQFLKQIHMNYYGLMQAGNYTMSLYVNDTQGNSDTVTRTFHVYDGKYHFISLIADSVPFVYYTDHITGEIIADLVLDEWHTVINITLPDIALDLQIDDHYTFGVIIPNLSDETQSIFIEEKDVDESNLSVSSRYIPKEAHAFSIFNTSRMNKTFRVSFDRVQYHGLTDPSKIVILKAPYNFTTGSIDYSSAIYYRLGDPLYPVYYKEPGTAWIYVTDFSVFALLEDKATTEVCADKIDNDYDGQIDEGCTTGGSGSSSSSGGGSKSAPPIKRECTTNSNCTSTQTCSNYKCINITCSSCEYIEDHACKKYPCCNDSECNTGELCKDHSCAKIVEEKEPTIVATGEQVLADNAIDSARKAIYGVTGKKDTKDAEEFLKKAIAARNNNDYANARVLAEKSRISLENAPLIQGKAIEAAAERPDLLLIALVAILIVLIILILFPKKKSAVSGDKKH